MRPRVNHNETVSVSINIAFLLIANVDQQKQTITFKSYNTYVSYISIPSICCSNTSFRLKSIVLLHDNLLFMMILGVYVLEKLKSSTFAFHHTMTLHPINFGKCYNSVPYSLGMYWVNQVHRN